MRYSYAASAYELCEIIIVSILYFVFSISSPSLENTAVTVSECVEFLNLGMSTDFDDEDLLSAVDNALKHGTVDQQLTISQVIERSINN